MRPLLHPPPRPSPPVPPSNQQQQGSGDDEGEIGDECRICMNAKVIFVTGHILFNQFLSMSCMVIFFGPYLNVYVTVFEIVWFRELFCSNRYTLYYNYFHFPVVILAAFLFCII